jgi:hypothetical protein
MTETGATACAAGLCAFFFAAVGLEPQTLVYGTVGAIFGLASAQPNAWFRSMCIFASVVLASALLGTWAADQWHAGARLPRNAWSMGIAAVFHPVFAALLAKVPAIIPALIDAVLRARTGGGDPK